MELDITIVGDTKVVGKKKSLRLTMRRGPYGDARITASDENGHKISNGTICDIQPDGTLYLFYDINPSLGLSLDDKGRIRLSEEDE